MNITDEQKDLLFLYLPNLRINVAADDIDTVLLDLDDKITEIGFNADYSLNKTGLKLQKLYDEIYTQN